MTVSPTNPKVTVAAKAGLPWAIKLTTTGYQSLSRKQRQAARAYVGVSMVPVVQTTTRRMVTAPVAKAIRQTNPKARIKSAGSTCTVNNSEMMGSVYGHSGEGINLYEFVVNPSEVATSIWLANMAAGYEQYTIGSVRLRYSPACGSETSGKVVLAFYKNAASKPPTTASELYMSEGAKSISAWDAGMISVPGESVKRPTRAKADEDKEVVDFGVFRLATYGQAADTMIGECFLDYTVTLYHPRAVKSPVQAGPYLNTEGPSYATVAATPRVVTLKFKRPGTYGVTVFSAGELSNIVGAGFVQFAKYGTLGAEQCVTVHGNTTQVGATITITSKADIAAANDIILYIFPL